MEFAESGKELLTAADNDRRQEVAGLLQKLKSGALERHARTPARTPRTPRGKVYSDSESESEADGTPFEEAEWERKKWELLLDLSELERHFTSLKEKYIAEKFHALKDESELLDLGRCDAWRTRKAALCAERDDRLEVSKKRRILARAAVQQQRDGDEVLIRKSEAEETALVQEQLRADIYRRMSLLEGQPEPPQPSPSSASTKKPIPVPVSGPYIVYQLSDRDILEDWMILKRSTHTESFSFNSHTYQKGDMVHVSSKGKEYRALVVSTTGTELTVRRTATSRPTRLTLKSLQRSICHIRPVKLSHT